MALHCYFQKFDMGGGIDKCLGECKHVKSANLPLKTLKPKNYTELRGCRLSTGGVVTTHQEGCKNITADDRGRS